MKAMLLAAGKGTRLQPLTNEKPKALIKINGKPLIQYAIEHLKHYGVNHIIVNTHHLGHQVKDFFESHNNFGVNIAISDESEELMNTGGGLVKASWFFNDGEPFFLYASDIVTHFNLSEMMQQHKQNNALVTMAVKERKTSRSLLFDEQNQLCGWRNNATSEIRMVYPANQPTTCGFSGIHCISPKIFKHITESGAFNITDLYLRLAEKYPIQAYWHNPFEWFEFGRYERLEETAQEMQNTNLQYP